MRSYVCSSENRYMSLKLILYWKLYSYSLLDGDSFTLGGYDATNERCLVRIYDIPVCRK